MTNKLTNYIQIYKGTQYVSGNDLVHLMSQEQISQFWEWMSGQTMMLVPPDITGIYPEDLQKFLNNDLEVYD